MPIEFWPPRKGACRKRALAFDEAARSATDFVNEVDEPVECGHGNVKIIVNPGESTADVALRIQAENIQFERRLNADRRHDQAASHKFEGTPFDRRHTDRRHHNENSQPESSP